MNSEGAYRYLKSKIPGFSARAAVIFGSGLSPQLTGARAHRPQERSLLPFRILQRLAADKIPGFPHPRVPGHPGRIVYGKLGRKPLLLFFGRAHFYEGHSFESLAVPFSAMARLGVRYVVATFACGSLVKRIRPGDLIVVRDQINLSGKDFLRGGGSRTFFAPGKLYSPIFNRRVLRLSKSSGARVHEAVYAGVSGPTYETPAEAEMQGRLGADVVGMSLVPEALAAKREGLSFGALGYAANRAGSAAPRMGHTGVLMEGRRIFPFLWGLIRRVLETDGAF